MRSLLVATFVSGLFLAGFSFSEAGVMDFIKTIFRSAQADRPEPVLSAQNMPLLEAPLNVDPLAGTGGGDITIVQNNALLPVFGPAGSLADVEAESKNSDQISIYIVREGDSLSEIAEMFRVSVNTIRWANDLTTSTVIRPGKVLIILPIDSIQHTVAKGETFEGIVKKYGGDIDETLAFNGWSPGYKPAVGTIVIVPDGEGEALTNSGAAARGTSGPVYAGYYIRPINGGRISQGLHGPNAKDFATYCGAPILASARGTVLVVRSQGWYGGYGSYVVVQHDNGTQTLYGHLSRVSVSAGTRVAQGATLGGVGSTGKSTGNHLHFEVRGATNPFR